MWMSRTALAASAAAGVRGEVGVGEFGGRFGKDSSDIDGDVAVADDRHARVVQRYVEVGEIGMPVVPADERTRAENARQIVAGHAEAAVAWSAGGDDDGVVEGQQVVDRDAFLSNNNIAHEPDTAGKNSMVAAVHRLDRLVVGGDAGSDQSVRRWQRIDNVDGDGVAQPTCERFGGVEARRPGSDDGDMKHRCTSPVAVWRRRFLWQPPSATARR